jgi:hypothetical protein
MRWGTGIDFVTLGLDRESMDCRVKPGNDEWEWLVTTPLSRRPFAAIG